LIHQDVKAGLKNANANFETGQKAMATRRYRRVGLGISLIAICVVVMGLGQAH
jgi:hypothetical protein